MFDTIKRIIKKSPIYTSYRNIKLCKAYAKKNNITIFKTFKEAKILDTNLPSILNKSKILDEGIGKFFYSLDSSIIIKNNFPIIDNMPVDYAYVINRALGDGEIDNIIKKYIKRINDPRISTEKPSDLRSALQAILFWNSLLWQTGHKLVGLGRLDKVLSPYPLPDNAEELICDFLCTLHCKYTFKSSELKGDTGQIIILGGLEENGSYFYNEYTSLFIKCLKKVNLPDPKILLRCSKNMPMSLLEIAIDCASTGIGSPLFSNDDVVIANLMDFGYEKQDAYNYGVSACWEPLSIGNSLEQNNLSNIEYGKCMNETITDSSFITCKNINEVIRLYEEKLCNNCNFVKQILDSIQWEKDPLLTLMMGLDKDISEGSAKYNNYGILSTGMSSAVNSILNIKRYVFDEKKYSLIDIQNIINLNYENGIEPFSSNDNGYGTENIDAINITNYLIKVTENNFISYRNCFGGKVKFGLSSPSYLDCGERTGATLDGRKACQPFQTHISRDKGEPLTEIINFESQLKFSGISSNANVIDVMVPPSLIKDNVTKFAQYIMGGIKEGIFQLQMNVLSYEQLIDAKKYPEKYPNLIVRVWGFSAYFNDLPEEYKDNLIKRAKEMERIA